MSCVVIRTVLPERRTLPSSTAPTLSLRATVAMSGCSLNEKDEARAATRSPSISTRELMSSSVRPSEKYSWSLSPLMLTNGSTAMEGGGGGTAPGGAPRDDGALALAGGAAGFEIHGLLMST